MSGSPGVPAFSLSKESGDLGWRDSGLASGGLFLLSAGGAIHVPAQSVPALSGTLAPVGGEAAVRPGTDHTALLLQGLGGERAAGTRWGGGRGRPCSYLNVNLSTLLSTSVDCSSWASGWRMDRRTLLTVAWRILCRAHRTEMALAVTLATSRPSMGRGPGDSGRAVCVAPPHPRGRGRGWRGGSGGALGTCRVASAETPVQPGLAEGAPQSSGARARADMPWTPASGWGRCRGAAGGAALCGLGLRGQGGALLAAWRH